MTELFIFFFNRRNKRNRFTIIFIQNDKLRRGCLSELPIQQNYDYLKITLETTFFEMSRADVKTRIFW